MSDRAELLEWGERFRTHPLARAFYRKATARGARICETPEDVLGDRMRLLADYLLIEHSHPGEMRMPARAENRAKHLTRAALAAFTAPPFVWPDGIIKAVVELPLPRHVISPRLLMVPRSWHAFMPELRMGLRDPDGGDWLDGRDYQIAACLVEDGGQGFVLTSFARLRKDGEPRPAIDAKRFDYGMTYPDDFEDNVSSAGEGKSDVELVLSMFAFLNSPFIPKETMRPNRDARRKLGLGKAEAVPETTFIVLRRPAGRKSNGDEPAGSVEWKHRWIVSGHYRAQWYPSEQAHRVIWIAPYMKGPEDAPMIEHVYKVAR